MRKIELIELVQDYLAGGDAPDDVRGRYHPEIISNMLAMAFNDIIMATYLEAKTYSDYSMLDSWALNYTLNITNSKVTLPYPPVQLPNNMGIRQVSPSDDNTNAFAYRENNANAVFAALEVGSISEKGTFYLEMETTTKGNVSVLYLGNVPTGCNSVKVKMIVPFEQMDDYDYVSIPGGKDKQLIGNVIEILRSKPPEDIINDNKAEQI